MKHKAYYKVADLSNNILEIPSVRVIGKDCIRVDFEYEADLCVELETNNKKYKSYGSKCPV